MRRDDENDRSRLETRLEERTEETPEHAHVVFDFTGLERVNVQDLSLIITARLQSAPTDNVWVRSIPWRTEQVLKILRLDHLFRHYPDADEQIN